MGKWHCDWWLEKMKSGGEMEPPVNAIYEYEMGNKASLDGERSKKEALLHYLCAMEMIKAWDTQDIDRKEFYRAIVLLGIGDTMEGLIPIHSKYECGEEAEVVFDILCSKAKLPEKISGVDVAQFAKMADVLWDYSVESRDAEDVETIYADVLIEDCMVGDLWLDDGPHGLIITQKAQSFICDHISEVCSSKIQEGKRYVLFQGVDPMIKVALKVHYLGCVSTLIDEELKKYVEFPMFPNYRRHGKLARRFGQNCDICGEEKYALWATRFESSRAMVCLDCIKSGRAGRENKGFIYEAYMMKDSDPVGKEEVLNRTPQPYNSWMNVWRTCCGKYARYIGRKKVSELDQYDYFRCRVCGEVYEDMCSEDEIKAR